MRIMGKILFWAVLILSAVIFTLPFWFMVCNSFEEFSYPYPAGARHSKARLLSNLSTFIFLCSNSRGKYLFLEKINDLVDILLGVFHAYIFPGDDAH